MGGDSGLHAGGHVHLPQRLLHATAAAVSAAGLYNTTVIGISLTVSATILAVALDGAACRADGGIDWTQEGHRSFALCADRSHAAGGDVAEPARAHLLALHAGTLRARRDRGDDGLHQRGVRRFLRRPRDVLVRHRNRAGWISGTLHFRTGGASFRLARRVSGHWHLESRRRHRGAAGSAQSQELRALRKLAEFHRGKLGPPAKSAVAGRLRHGLRGAVLPGGRLHLCELLSRRSAVSISIPRNWAACSSFTCWV